MLKPINVDDQVWSHPDGAARDRASTNSDAWRLRNWAILSRRVDEITVNARHDGVACLAQASRILRYGIQYGGEIRWRAGDDTQDLGSSRLLLQRLGDLAVALLKLGVALL